MTLPEVLSVLLDIFLAAVVLVPVVIWALSISWRGPEDTPQVAFLRAINRIYVGLVHHLWRRREEDPLPATGAYIVVANHQSGVDPHLLAAITRRWIHFLMAREYYEARGLHWLFRTLKCIPVRRSGNDLGATRAALKALKAGRVVGIFPQGGIRDADDPLGVGKAGVALLALRTGAPVVPLCVQGSPISKSVFGTLLLPSRSRILQGKPLCFPRQESKPTREDLNRVTSEILSAITRLKAAANGELVEEAPPTTESAEPAETVAVEHEAR